MISSFIACTAYNLVAGATLIWPVPLHLEVEGDLEPVGRVTEHAELIGIPGSILRLQLCVRPGRGGWKSAEAEAANFDDGWPPPVVSLFREGEDTGAPGDLLYPAGTFDIETHTTRAIWFAQYIPSHVDPGSYVCKLNFPRENGPAQVFHIRVRVADVSDLKEKRLPVSLGLGVDRGADVFSESTMSGWIELGRRLGIAFTPMGVALPNERIAWATAMADDGLEFDMGGGPEWLGAYPVPRSPRVVDPLVEVLQRWGNLLDDGGNLGKVFLVPNGDGDRGSWPEIRDSYLRIRRADSRLRLGIVGHLHPRYLPLADVLAVPWSRYDFGSHQRFMETGGLGFRVGWPAAVVDSNSSGGDPDGIPEWTEPRDAYDGSPTSFWWSRVAPKAQSPVRFRIDFRDPEKDESFTIGWAANGVGRDLVVRSSSDGIRFARTRVDWSEPVLSGDGRNALMDGEFRAPKPVKAIEFEIRGSVNGGRVGIAEIEFSPPGSIIPGGRDTEIWLAGSESGFGSLATSELRGDGRLIPWLCATQGFEGFLALRAVNQGRDALVHKSSAGPLPLTTARAELLHEGLQDYILFRNAMVAARKADDLPDDVRAALSTLNMGIDADAETREALAGGLEERRRVLIRWLEAVEP